MGIPHDPQRRAHRPRPLASLSLPAPVAAWLTDELARGYDDTTTQTEDERSRRQKRLTELTGLQARAYEDKLTGAITSEFWSARNTAWTEDFAMLRSRLHSLDDPPTREEFLRVALDPIELLKTAQEEWVTRRGEEKADLVKPLVSNYTVTDKTIVPSMRSPFDLLADGIKSGDWWTTLGNYRTRILATSTA